MFKHIKNFISGGFEEMNEVLVKPFLRLSFYKQCFLLIAAGVILYLPYLNAFNATHDEQYTLLLCRYDILKMIGIIIVEDGHPPLYYLIAKLWVELFGGDIHNVVALHLMVLSIFVATAMLGVFPLRRLLGEQAALIFICLVFVLPSSSYLARDVRMYSLAVFLMIGEFIYAMLFVYKEKKGDLIKFSLFSLAAIYTHYYCVILTAVIFGIVLIDLLRLKKYRDLKFFILSSVLIGLAYIPWLWPFYMQYQNMSRAWYPKMLHVISSIDGAFFLYDNVNIVYDRLCVYFGVLVWVLVLEFLIVVNKEKIEHIVAKRAVMVFWSIYTIALVLSIFILPNLVTRYMVIPVGILYVALSVVVIHFNKFRKLLFGMLVIVFAMGYGDNYDKVWDDVYHKISDYIKNDLPKKSLILYDFTRGHLLLEFYAPEVDKYFVPRSRYLVLLQDEVKKEDQYLRKLTSYDKAYMFLSYVNSLDSSCINRFFSEVTGETFCLKEVLIKDVNKLVERTAKIKEASFHKDSLW